MRRIALILGLIWVVFSTACQSVADLEVADVENFLDGNDVINLPITFTEQGLIAVSTQLDEATPVFMIVDTGATQSAIYKNIARRLGLKETSDKVNVTGLVTSGDRPEVTLPFIGLDSRRLENVKVAVLETFTQETVPAVKIGGIIGLDILEKYYVFFDHERQILSLIPYHYSFAELPTTWSRINLTPNPYIEDGRPLKYFNIRFIGQIVPALFDTGSEFNIMNWPAIKHPQAWDMRESLRKDWKLKGSIGKFEPKILIKTKSLRSRQKFWRNRNFLVFGLESLNILGIDGQPLIIAGADMFTDSTFWLDLKAGELVIKPRNSVEDARKAISFIRG